MIVLSVTDCPPRLRGDLSKWLLEINTGVYVGKVSARVREELWKRVKDNLSNGRATLVFDANNEQGVDFYVHNTTWIPVDFEGIKLIKRPAQGVCVGSSFIDNTHSNASIQKKTENIQKARARKQQEQGYVILDLETTGLDESKDEIIEIAVIRIVEHKIVEKMSLLVKSTVPIPAAVQQLTGISDDMLCREGIALKDALEQLSVFVQDSPKVSHNANFDKKFLMAAYQKEGMPFPRSRWVDTLELARRCVDGVPNYKLSTLMEYFRLPEMQHHRALNDCEALLLLYEKLNEIR